MKPEYKHYISYEDYRGQIDVDQWRAAIEGDLELRQYIEARAIGDACNYLRGRFDLDGIFLRRGEHREPTLLGRIIDIALYYAFTRLEPAGGHRLRAQLYKAAIKYLEQVRAGSIDPGLPLLMAPDTGEVQESTTVLLGSNSPTLHYD